mmetsp:Transcript_49969/g.140010  ORF Transcript_49969/g.140010 Transcript_49969/m.140010 type:complete len:231 (+) Transcript_49969:685-1377(+)
MIPSISDEHLLLDLGLVQHGVDVRADVDYSAEIQDALHHTLNLLANGKVLEALATHCPQRELQEFGLDVADARAELLALADLLTRVIDVVFPQLRDMDEAGELWSDLNSGAVLRNFYHLNVDFLADIKLGGLSRHWRRWLRRRLWLRRRPWRRRRRRRTLGNLPLRHVLRHSREVVENVHIRRGPARYSVRRTLHLERVWGSMERPPRGMCGHVLRAHASIRGPLRQKCF